MKRFLLSTLASFFLASAAHAAPATYEIDPNHSSVTFTIHHLVSTVPGRFNEIAGNATFDPENPAAATFEVTIQTASIDTDQPKRDTHLRSADFFDAEAHPTITFKSVSVSGTADALQVSGDLTLRGVTKRLILPLAVSGPAPTPMGTRIGVSTEFTINRQEFGVSWNHALDQGGFVLGDDVKIVVAVEAVQK